MFTLTALLLTLSAGNPASCSSNPAAVSEIVQQLQDRIPAEKSQLRLTLRQLEQLAAGPCDPKVLVKLEKRGYELERAILQSNVSTAAERVLTVALFKLLRIQKSQIAQ